MIEDNLENIEKRIAAACERAGRTRNEVQLLAVTKTFPVADIQTAYGLGLRCFGENRVVELRDKRPQLPEDAVWHLIGHLQHNKVRQALKISDWIHSIDSMELLELVNEEAKKAGRFPKLLLEVNVSGEESKFGIAPDELPEIVKHAVDARKKGGCPVVGLMTMAPMEAPLDVLQQVFGGLRQLKEEMNGRFGAEMTELSMGMSGDFEVAIEEGATIVRVGSAIFGYRSLMAAAAGEHEK